MNIMRSVLVIFTLFLFAGCAATATNTSKVTYQDESFSEEALKTGDVAVLPIVAGSGVEGYRRPFGQAINNSARALIGAESVVTWQDTMDRLNDSELVSAYNDAISSYQQTSIIDRSLVQAMGEATRTKYFLYITLLPPTNNSSAEYSYLTGNVYESQHMGVDAFGQVWDAVSGDVIWEGTGSSHVQTGEFTYIKREEQDINQYSDNAAESLVRAILNLPPMEN